VMSGLETDEHHPVAWIGLAVTAVIILLSQRAYCNMGCLQGQHAKNKCVDKMTLVRPTLY